MGNGSAEKSPVFHKGGIAEDMAQYREKKICRGLGKSPVFRPVGPLRAGLLEDSIWDPIQRRKLRVGALWAGVGRGIVGPWIAPVSAKRSTNIFQTILDGL